MKKFGMFHLIPLAVFLAMPQIASAQQEKGDCCFQDRAGTQVCVKSGDQVVIHDAHGYRLVRIRHIWSDGVVEYRYDSTGESAAASLNRFSMAVAVDLQRFDEFSKGQRVMIHDTRGYRSVTIRHIWDDGVVEYTYDQTQEAAAAPLSAFRNAAVYDRCDAHCAVERAQDAFQQANNVGATYRDEDPRVSGLTRKQLADSIDVLNLKLKRARAIARAYGAK